MLSVLRELDSKLEGIQRKVKLYCLGGTVLVLSDLRHSSKDVDFIVSREDFLALSGHVAEIEWKKNVRFDLFPNGLLPDYKYSDYASHAQRFPLTLKNIDIYFLDTIDLVLTKAIAGREHDIQDIGLLVPSKDQVPKEELLRRFENVTPKPEKAAEIKSRFEKFVLEFYK